MVSRLDGESLGYFGMSEAIAALYTAPDVKQPPKLLHCLRHTFGTEMAKKGPLAVLQRLIGHGHADMKTTLRYVDVDEEQKRETIDTVFGRGSHVAATPKTRRYFARTDATPTGFGPVGPVSTAPTPSRRRGRPAGRRR